MFYALMDFNQSIQLPVDTSLKVCRRSYEEADYGAMHYKPDDAWWGNPTYNPFAYDVGTLGNMFRFHFSVSTRVLISIRGDVR